VANVARPVRGTAMKVLDTPVLLGLLRGEPAARAYVRAQGAEELATTEIALWELACLARLDPSPGRDRRLAAVARLRRKLLVLPVDAAASEASGRLPPPSRGVPPLTLLSLAAAIGHGGTVFVTGNQVGLPTLPSGVRAERYDKKHAKKR
jgi:predicted nucleic acid-binding protein